MKIKTRIKNLSMNEESGARNENGNELCINAFESETHDLALQTNEPDVIAVEMNQIAADSTTTIHPAQKAPIIAVPPLDTSPPAPVVRAEIHPLVSNLIRLLHEAGRSWK